MSVQIQVEKELINVKVYEFLYSNLKVIYTTIHGKWSYWERIEVK